MKTGRPSLPLEVKIAKGHVNGRMPQHEVPERVPGIPDAPPHFNEDALYCWNHATSVLHARGQLSMESLLSLVALCECYADWVAIRRDIQENGRSYDVETISGSIMEKARPQVAMLQDCDRRFRMWLNEFGLTDGTRHKVTCKPHEDEAENPLERYNLN